MKKYVIATFVFCAIALQLSAMDRWHEYKTRRENLRDQQAAGYRDPVELEREGLYREYERRHGDKDERGVFWMIPSKEKRQQIAKEAKVRWAGFKQNVKQKRKDFNWFGLKKKKEGE